MQQIGLVARAPLHLLLQDRVCQGHAQLCPAWAEVTPTSNYSNVVVLGQDSLSMENQNRNPPAATGPHDTWMIPRAGTQVFVNLGLRI